MSVYKYWKRTHYGHTQLYKASFCGILFKTEQWNAEKSIWETDYPASLGFLFGDKELTETQFEVEKLQLKMSKHLNQKETHEHI